MEQTFCEIPFIPQDARSATKHVLSLLLDKIHPLMIHLRHKLIPHDDTEEGISKVRDVFTLCSSQINKSLINLFDVFKIEIQHHTSLQESRQYTLERLYWCINKLVSLENYLEKSCASGDNESANDSFNITTMYFVNWIDHTFEILGKLSDAIYKTDYKESKALYTQWKDYMVECVSELHVTIDELLLTAMTLCRYCLADDQHIVKARCQVVLRETKALLGELIEGDLSSVIKVTPDSLKLPIMPSNANVLIDVLKDVLYALETNTNTALLALVVHCFTYNKPPIAILKEHFNNDTKGTCSCLVKSEDDLTENCSFVKDFDLYNERLLQIGNFAVSCSSDQNRILSLRSGLATLEALDPHLVPAIMMSPESHHATFLMNSWTQEVQDIRDSVFLIIDPSAFAEKLKQMMHYRLVAILKDNTYNNLNVCAVINMGCMVYDFFHVYDECEPDALTHYEKLLLLLADLDKVQRECKIVSNLLCSNEDFVYDVKMPSNNKDVSFDQLVKRLKLLYTLVTRIHSLHHPKENDDQWLGSEGEEEPQKVYKNETHTVLKNSDTYVNSLRKPVNNMSRTIFARGNVGSSTRNFPLSKLTKCLKTKMCSELSFSVQLDQLFNTSESRERNAACDETIFVNKQMVKVTNSSLSVLYNVSPIRNRPSLRKAVLNKQCKMPIKKDIEVNDMTYDKDSLMDETTSLQITDILNQMNDMTSMLSAAKFLPVRTQRDGDIRSTSVNDKDTQNVLRINVNNQNTTITKHIWNIPVNASVVEMPLEDSGSNTTQPSNVGTLERIHDLDYVESKLNSLKTQLETSL